MLYAKFPLYRVSVLELLEVLMLDFGRRTWGSVADFLHNAS